MSLFLVSITSATYLGLLGRANRLCPAVIDTVTVTSVASITVPELTVNVIPSLPSATTYLPPAACLSDDQATNVVTSWRDVLTQTDRSIANATAQELIADEFLGTSDSINALAGISVSSPIFALFSSKSSQVPPVFPDQVL